MTHSPPVYVAVLLPLGFWVPLAWIALAGSLLHFTLDLWEYGLRLNPFRNRIFGARLIPGIERMAFRDYLALLEKMMAAEGDDLAEARAALKETFGIDLDADVVGALSGEMGFAFAEPQGRSLPMPLTSIMLKGSPEP